MSPSLSFVWPATATRRHDVESESVLCAPYQHATHTTDCEPREETLLDPCRDQSIAATSKRLSGKDDHGCRRVHKRSSSCNHNCSHWRRRSDDARDRSVAQQLPRAAAAMAAAAAAATAAAATAGRRACTHGRRVQRRGTLRVVAAAGRASDHITHIDGERRRSIGGGGGRRGRCARRRSVERTQHMPVRTGDEKRRRAPYNPAAAADAAAAVSMASVWCGASIAVAASSSPHRRH